MLFQSRRLLSVLAIVAVTGLLTPAAPRAQERSFDLLTASIADIQAAVDAGKLTYEGLVGLYLKRIEAYDKQGPRLNAVITVNPRALEILGRPYSEPSLFKIAHGYEQASKHRVPPKSTPHLPGDVIRF